MAYSDGFRTEAMIRLGTNHFDYDLTAEQMGCTARTLHNWEKNFPKNNVTDLLDRAIVRMLSIIPNDMSGHDWAIALGILMDKWLLLQGEPTSRNENITMQMDNLNADEYERVIAEAESIIASAKGS